MDREEEEDCQSKASDEWDRADNDEYTEKCSGISSTTDVLFMSPHLHYVRAQSFGFVCTISLTIKNGIYVDLFLFVSRSNADKTKFMFTSREQNWGKICNMKIDVQFFEERGTVQVFGNNLKK
jgi:hypothetical protein